jgi:DNA repair photolyase
MTEKGYTPDQPKIAGADVIYRPKGNAGEYAALATNPYKGCGHCCAYCYVPGATHISRPDFDAGAVPRPDYRARLWTDVRRYRDAGICNGHPADQVFITFSSDPYHPGEDISPTVRAIETLTEGGMSFCTLSKGGTKALPYLSLYRPDRDAYAASLTSLDDHFSLKWERKARLPGDRIEALKKFHEAGIFTWVSLEPTLDADASIAIVEATHGFVNLFKIGKANYVPTITNTVDWRQYTLRMLDTVSRLGCKFYFKRDLQAHLPQGIQNHLRIPQHH